MPRLALASASLLLCLGAACGARDPSAEQDSGPQPDAGADARVDAAPDDVFTPPPADGGTPEEPARIYAHTDTHLFQADPTVLPLTLTEVGAFDCIGGEGQALAMTDLALDQDANLFGISSRAVHPLEIQDATVHCVDTWPLPEGARFYGLSFVPAGVLQDGEMLVAANTAGELWSLEAMTGAATLRGTFGVVPSDDGRGHSYDSGNVGQAWELSGDLVFLANDGDPVGFATVRDCPNPPDTTGCNPVDTLIEIDVGLLSSGSGSAVTRRVIGMVVKEAGCDDPSPDAGYGSLLGIAAWNDSVYGFSRAGDLVGISIASGEACLIEHHADARFAGAGVTTLAPVND